MTDQNEMNMNETEREQVSGPLDEDHQEDQLLALPAEKLASMLRDKRRAEASVRTKLREAEAERDRLSGAVAGYQRRAFAEAAKASRMQESALDDVLAVVDLDSMLGEDGVVDSEKVKVALTELRRQKPHFFAQVPRAAGVDMYSFGQPEPSRRSTSWSEVLG